jgi:hypothetical protein
MNLAPCNGCGLSPLFRHSTAGVPQVTLEHAAGTDCPGRTIVITNSHDGPATAEANMTAEWNKQMGVRA